MLCPAAEDAALCEEYVRGYWGEITATPTCDECRGSITRVAEVISSPEQDAEIVAFLQSDWCPGTEDVE